MPSDDDYEEEVAPKPKKAKTKKASDDEEDDDVAEGGDGKANKVQRNGDGEAYFDFSKNKRCTVRKWKDMVLVDIREVSSFHHEMPWSFGGCLLLLRRSLLSYCYLIDVMLSFMKRMGIKSRGRRAYH